MMEQICFFFLSNIKFRLFFLKSQKSLSKFKILKNKEINLKGRLVKELSIMDSDAYKIRRTEAILIMLCIIFLGKVSEIRRWLPLCKIQQSTFSPLLPLRRRFRLRCSFRRAPEALPYFEVWVVWFKS